MYFSTHHNLLNHTRNSYPHVRSTNLEVFLKIFENEKFTSFVTFYQDLERTEYFFNCPPINFIIFFYWIFLKFNRFGNFSLIFRKSFPAALNLDLVFFSLVLSSSSNKLGFSSQRTQRTVTNWR